MPSSYKTQRLVADVVVEEEGWGAKAGAGGGAKKVGRREGRPEGSLAS